MLDIKRPLCNALPANLLIVFLSAVTISCATGPAVQTTYIAAPASSTHQSSQAPGTALPVPEGRTPSMPAAVAPASDNGTLSLNGPDVRIMLIHYRGTQTRIGCCNPGFYERDEFVVIQNVGDMPQDINNWSLTNITKGYPTFYFPSHYPCLPNSILPPSEIELSGSYYSPVQNPAKSESNIFSTEQNTTKPVNIPAGEVSWDCGSSSPPDQTPMKPAKGQQGIPQPCVLNPGQVILVFTDEVHCASGGLSFNWGLGNIWDNEVPNTAVLYNDKGEEVSRRSYTVRR